MAINPAEFYEHNIIDTCSIMNILSSDTLYRATKLTKACFYCTEFVVYECLYKPRKESVENDLELQKRLVSARNIGDFKSFQLDYEDLQVVDALGLRKKLGLGELSSLALAIKTRQAFLTDDQPARKFALTIPEVVAVQTVPHLISWLFFTRVLSDGEKDEILKEHEEMGGILSKYIVIAYNEALRCLLMVGRPLMKSGR